MFSDFTNSTVDTTISGFWGPPTSGIDWCESNYSVSYFIAEWWNSISNLICIALAICAITRECSRVCPDGLNFIVYMLYIFVFCGSTIFHVTLSFFGQFLDEAGMVVLLSFFHFLISKNYFMASIKLTILTISIILWVTVSFPDPAPLRISFGTLVAIFPIRLGIRSELRGSVFLYKSILFYSIGFILWLIDVWQCRPVVRSFQLHAVWHVLTGIGGYLCIQACSIARSMNERKGCYIEHVRIANLIDIPQVFIQQKNKDFKKVIY